MQAVRREVLRSRRVSEKSVFLSREFFFHPFFFSSFFPFFSPQSHFSLLPFPLSFSSLPPTATATSCTCDRCPAPCAASCSGGGLTGTGTGTGTGKGTGGPLLLRRGAATATDTTTTGGSGSEGETGAGTGATTNATGGTGSTTAAGGTARGGAEAGAPAAAAARGRGSAVERGSAEAEEGAAAAAAAGSRARSAGRGSLPGTPSSRPSRSREREALCFVVSVRSIAGSVLEIKKQKNRSPLYFSTFSLHFSLPLSLNSLSLSTLSPSLSLPSSTTPGTGEAGLQCARRLKGCGKGADRKKFLHLSRAPARAPGMKTRGRSRRKKNFHSLSSPGHLESDRESPEFCLSKELNCSRHPSIFSSREGEEREEGKGGGGKEKGKHEVK